MRRAFASPSKWTFEIPPIKQLIYKYVGNGKQWVDPFAGITSPAEFTNDINPESKAKYHLEARAFIRQLNGQMFDGVLLDPPYSPRQIKECYENVGLAVSMTDTQNCVLYSETRRLVAPKIRVGGYAISCGWNSNGLGKNLGFEIVEILIVAHGAAHNDTIVVVEKKFQSDLFAPGASGSFFYPVLSQPNKLRRLQNQLM
jgi:hypothetical protein